MTRNIQSRFCALGALLFLLLVLQPGDELFAKDRRLGRKARLGRTEASADISFIKGDYERAMRVYERTWTHTSDMDENKDRLALKMARLYTLLQQSDNAIRCYGLVHSSVDTLLTVEDVCYYVDALRRADRLQDAEVVARHYAFLRPYSRNQRYLNTLYALSNQQYYYDKGDADYKVEMLEICGPLAEYWLGDWGGKTFYAESRSSIQDPQKIFYHRTQFISLKDNKPEEFRDIPRELQSGPLCVSPDGQTMITTGISYRSIDRILAPGVDKSVFVSQLYYSIHDSRRNGWSRFLPLFPNQEGYSYAHPVFLNEGRSLIFASDRPGGYGGMDLYICQWQDSTASWSVPVNMGPEVNTEGDEAYPRVIGDALFFASNGHEGYGGYDIYRVSFGRNLVMPGTLFHYPYPVNSVYNDFGIFFDQGTGYFVSDRRGPVGKDDVYIFDATVSPLSSGSAIGVSAEYSAMVGNLNLITGLGNSNTVTHEMKIREIPPILLTENGQLLLRIFFDFNSFHLDESACRQLQKMLAEEGFNDLEEIAIIGYADEIGTPEYNVYLSKKRAEVVAKYLKVNGAKPNLIQEGRGQVEVPLDEQTLFADTLSIDTNAELQSLHLPLTREERIRAYRKARRVEIVIRKKD